jgi:hypothetical protein
MDTKQQITVIACTILAGAWTIVASLERRQATDGTSSWGRFGAVTIAAAFYVLTVLAYTGVPQI